MAAASWWKSSRRGTRKTVSQKAMNYMSPGMALFLGFFVIMLNQDIQSGSSSGIGG